MQDKSISTTFLKGLDVLRAFHSGDTDLTQADLARRTGFDRATVRRLCLTLVSAGYVTDSERGYRLAPKVLTLAGSFLRANAVGHAIQPVLNACADRLGGEVTLAVRDHLDALFVAQSTTKLARVSFGFTIGSTLPLLPTAVGRMLLAGLSPDERAALIAAAPIESYTADTEIDRARIAERIDAAARTGTAIVQGEYEAGICGLAVPITVLGRSRAVLGTSLPLASVQDDACRAAALSDMQVAAVRLAELPALHYW